jgi:sigma-B regulation protein RsbU (phosphoserine phosphatase)
MRQQAKNGDSDQTYDDSLPHTLIIGNKGSISESRFAHFCASCGNPSTPNSQPSTGELLWFKAANLLRCVLMRSAETPTEAAQAPKPTVKQSLRVLIVEDSEFDAHMIVSMLRKGGYEVSFQRVETANATRAALSNGPWDVVLADYNLPEFNAANALKIVQQSGLDIPFIIVSGGIGEDVAVSAMKAGAHDYVMKGNLSRLVPAVERELRDAANRASQRNAERALQESELRYRLLWETAPEAIILMDPAGTIHFANPAVTDVFGFSPEEVVGMNVTALQPVQLRGQYVAAVKRFLASRVERLNWRAVETLGLRKDGAEIPIEVSFSAMNLGSELRFVVFIRDITERKRAERELRENKEQFRVAREIQQRLFPKSAPNLPPFEIGGASYPAEATGGDYFDYLPMLNQRFGIVLGDVTGHGVGPALLMAETRAYLRVLAGRREDVGEILTRANRVLAEDVGTERFITLFLARLDPQARALTYASAGHSAGHVLNACGDIKALLPRTGIPLGMRSETEYTASPAINLDAGDVIVLLTDGIEECLAPDSDLFGNERALEVVRQHREKPAQQIVEQLYQAVRRFSGDAPQTDDVTAVIIKVH